MHTGPGTDENREQRDEEGFIQTPDGKVWYRIVGGGSAGIPLLVLHGGPGFPHDYLEPLEALADERPVIFYDQLGCGRSDRPDDPSLWTIERYVDEVAAVREALGLKAVHLLGQSWGTMLAVAYLVREGPTGIVSAVLSAPYISTPRWIADQRAYLAAMTESVQEAVRVHEASGDFAAPAYQEAMTAYYQEHLCRLETRPDCLQRSMDGSSAAIYAQMWGPSEFTVTGTLRTADLTDRLPSLTIPVLYTCGEFDEATPATTRFYQELTPDAGMIVLAGASHQHHLEEPEQFLAAVRRFLAAAEERR
ncbi:proline iminopeptidase-family hydrolase [Methanosphaerula palustris]|uniref:Proline iminopeptidase n=1 Tax=Methanosphaerula palustris (strain ATCC BAA-1556 / DSM 19958 / E1-9c) TaxID=521011 RepID=B8GKS2_METPE|nr:proline iminopeptidase-family hydrolase [Methanosphaerula palustris]ACL17218.1 proline-specific peptidase [Methanosphaerula palustris E1-9c]